MTQSFNIGFNFRAVAANQPDAPAIIAEDITVSYEKLWKITESFALRMRENGIGQASIVAVHTSDIIVSLASLLASSLLGAQYIAVSKELTQGGVVNPSHYLRSSDTTGPDDSDYILIDQTWAPAFAKVDENAPYPGYTAPDTPWLLLHSSGTTGRAKYMTLSQRLVFDRSQAVRDDFNGQSTRVSLLFTCQTRPFYARALAALLHGSTIVDSLSPAFWAQEKVTVVCGSPFQVNRVLSGTKEHDKIAFVEVSGSKLTLDVARVLSRAFTDVIEVYGAGETNKSFANKIEVNALGQMQALGLPLDSTVEIVDEQGMLCKNGISGSIRVKNGYTVPGYMNAPEAAKKSFNDGWFYPGDYGHWGPNGALVIEGRHDELINISGVKFNPSVVDDRLLKCEGVKAAACFLSPLSDLENKLMAFVELTDFDSPDRYVNQAHAACAKAFGTVVAPQHIVVVPEIPKTEDGAPKRQSCREMAIEIIKQSAGPGR